jgi:amino-acid N-acetyltransferase
MQVTVRRARTADVRGIRRLVAMYVADRRLLSKPMVALYEAVQEFWVAERDSDGTIVVAELIEAARELGVRRVFVLTFETRFFSSFGFVPIDGTPVTHQVYEELLRSYDEGVAEFLDLERVKPNTLGNHRMLLHL